MRRCKWGDQSILSLLVTNFSAEAGLRVPYLVSPLMSARPTLSSPYTRLDDAKGAMSAGDSADSAARFTSENELKDPSELLGRFADPKDRPSFLLQEVRAKAARFGTHSDAPRGCALWSTGPLVHADRLWSACAGPVARVFSWCGWRQESAPGAAAFSQVGCGHVHLRLHGGRRGSGSPLPRAVFVH